MESMRVKGTGSVVQIGKKYHARWRINGKDEYGPARDTRDEAELDRITKKPDERIKISAKDMPTLLAWAQACMDQNNEEYGYYGRGLEDSTYNTNETIMMTVLKGSNLAKKKLNKIESDDVEAWVRNIQKANFRFVDGQRIIESYVDASPSWKRRCHAFISKIFTLAIKHKLLKVNPAFGIELPYVPERENRVLSVGESVNLYDVTDRTGDMIIVSMDAGLRRSELRRIKWNDIEAAGLWVTNNKGNKQRDLIPLTEEARSALMRQPKRSIFVFSTESGRQLSLRNITRDVKNRLEKLGISPEVRLQDLRGTFVNSLVNAGVDIKTTQKLARHSSPKTTLKAYLRTNMERKEEAIDLMRKHKGLVNGVSEEDSVSKSG